ncbi:MAG: glycosyltransferase family 1 protein [Patescibacteria group bacterium]|jgi:glycosyltransferase involved in cell wall biosynthesis
MLIGIDASRANIQKKTGTEWVSYHIIQELKKIADPHDQYILYSKEPLIGDLSVLPVNFKNKVLKWNPKYLWTQLRLSWEMLFHEVDVLYVSAHTIPIIHPSNTIATLHDVGFENNPEFYSQKLIGPDNSLIKRIIYILVKVFTLGRYSNNELDYHRWSTRLALKAKTIVTVSNFSKIQIIDKFHVNPDKIKVIYNGFNQDYKKIDNLEKIKSVLKKYQITTPFLLNIGRLEYKKGTIELIKAFSIFIKKIKNSHKLILIGNPGNGFSEIKKLIDNLNLNEKIIMPGWVGENDLPYIMNAADLFVFPSRYEGFGIPIIEAMACQIPVITSNFGAMKEVSGNAALLINPDNLENLAQSIDTLINDKKLRSLMIQNGLKNIIKYSWETSAKQIKTLFA